MQHLVGLCEEDNGDCTLNRLTSETMTTKSGYIQLHVRQHVVGRCEVDNGDCILTGPTSEMVIIKSG